MKVQIYKQTGEKSGDTERSTAEEKYVIVNNGNGAQPVLIAEISPRIRGVVIVCSGSESAKSAIQSAVTTALDIPSMKVCVICV